MTGKRTHAQKVLQIPSLVRDPDSGMLVVNSKKGRKMPKHLVMAAIAQSRAERAARGMPAHYDEEVPF